MYLDYANQIGDALANDGDMFIGLPGKVGYDYYKKINGSLVLQKRY